MSKQLYGTIKGFDANNLDAGIDVLIDGNEDVTKDIPSTLTEAKLNARCILELEGTLLTVTGMVGGQELYKDTKQAKDDAAKAKADAETALNSANSKNKITHSTSNPNGTNHSKDDIWYKYDSGNNIVGQWRWDGSKWISQQIDSKAIASIDAGKITAGTIDASISMSSQGSITGGKFKTSEDDSRIEIYNQIESNGDNRGIIDFYIKNGDITRKSATLKTESSKFEPAGELYIQRTELKNHNPTNLGAESYISIVDAVEPDTNMHHLGSIMLKSKDKEADVSTLMSIYPEGITLSKRDMRNPGVDIEYTIEGMNTMYDDNGRYLKLSNGILICWHSTTIRLAIDNPYGALFTGNFSWRYPHKFVEPPTVVTPGVKWGNSACWGALAATPTSTVAYFKAIDVVKRAAGDTQISCFAIGRWQVN